MLKRDSFKSNLSVFYFWFKKSLSGAFIFVSIESKQNENAKKLNDSMFAYRQNLTNQLWNITVTANNFDPPKYIDK